MVSSLPVGQTSYGGPQRAPAGGRSSFLTTEPGAPPMADSDLRRLLAAQRASQAEAVSHARALVPAAPAPVPQPWSTHRGAFGRQGIGAFVSSVGTVGEYDIRHVSEGRFTEDTIANMHKAVLQAKTDAKWRQMMEDIRQLGRRLGAIGWKDYAGEARWFDNWYRRQHPIDYVRDPHQVELVNAPILTYMKGLGDCDDSSTLWAASMGSLGAAHKFRTYRADPRRPDEWSHVVSQVWIPGHGWVNNDLTIKSAVPGFEPSGFPYKDWLEPKW
jgi:hypothetical protein